MPSVHATTITMPQLGETVTEGTVLRWLKRVGDRVEKYEPFVEIATDKVNAEVPAPVAGALRELLVGEGETVPTGAPIAVIETGAAPSAAADAAEAPAAPANGAPANGAARNGAAAGETLDRRISPAVRRLARERRVDVAALTGTGAGGRITANDVLAAGGPAAAQPASDAARANGETIPLTPARRIIAERMVASKTTAPHAWTMVEVDVTNVVRRREREKDAFARERGAKLTLLPFFIRAVVESLARFPLVNAKYTPEGIRVFKDVNVGIAVALDDGVVVPVLRNAERLSIGGLAVAAAALVERARRGKLGPGDLAGGTLTVNNTGAIGSVSSAPIIHAGQAAIVTMEAVVKRPVVVGDDAIVIRSMMNVCTSFDHRVLDGVAIAGYLNEIKRRLEATGPEGTL